MFGVGRGVTSVLVGWLWADLLLGLFVIFLAASAAPSREATVAEASPPATRAVDPKPVELMVYIEGRTLLSDDSLAVGQEQRRIAEQVVARLIDLAAGREVAVALAFASHEDAVTGDKLARLGTDALTSGPFEGSVIKPYHSIVAGDTGTTLSFELYLYR